MLHGNSYSLDKTNAKFLGVCSGFARFSGLPVFWVRTGLVVLTLIHMGFITLPAYFITALVANGKPTRRENDYSYDDLKPRYRTMRDRY